MTVTKRKQFSAELAVSDQERAVVAQISTSAVDRDGEVLLSQGCDATEFFKSPTVFFNHDYTQPVGKCVAITRHRDRLEAKTIFASRPDGHQGDWLPDTMLSLFQQGVVRGFSVGFVPVEGRRPTRLDREVFGAQVRYVYSKWKLLEYSVAPMPANQDALALAVSKGVVSADLARRWFPMTKQGPEPAPPRRRVVLVVGKRRRPVPDLAACVDHEILKRQGRLYA